MSGRPPFPVASGPPRRDVPHPAGLDDLLVSGGDARLAVDPATGLNGYGCRPWPRPAAISFASSTASTISGRAYAAAGSALARLRARAAERGLERAASDAVEEVRAGLAAQLALPGHADVVLVRSGTDAVVHALALSRGLLGRPVLSVLVAADETGSGVPLAAAGRHFSAATAAGIVKGDAIAGLASAIVCIPQRDGHGRPRTAADIDEEVRARVARAIADGFGVALHVMDHSKLGSSAPGLALVRDLVDASAGAVAVIVDACQMRLSRARLGWYLDQGFIVLATGSKFFCGPAFCAAMLIPHAARLRGRLVGPVPAGLAAYGHRHDWPAAWTRVRAALPQEANIGALLRWTAAIEEMRGYFEVPALLRAVALGEFAAAVERRIAPFPELRLWSRPECTGIAAAEFATPTVFPFGVVVDGRPASYEETRVLYRALNEDVSGRLAARGGDKEVAARLCHIGQPVAIARAEGEPVGVLRISADARFVSEAWASAGPGGFAERLNEPLAGITAVFEKLRLLVPRLGDLRRRPA